MNLGVMYNSKNPSESIEVFLSCAPDHIDAYIIRPDEIFENHVIGWKFDGSWKKHKKPFPDVIYNRLSKQSEPKHKMVRRNLAIKGIPIFPYSFFDKYDFYKVLKDHPSVPETRRYSETSLNLILAKYDGAYIKPRNGSLGNGIIKITGNNVATTNTVNASRSVLNGLKNHIVQQPIDGIKHQGKVINIRVVACRDGFGVWQIPLMFSRVAGDEDAITSHASRGGGYVALDDVLKDVDGAKEKLSEVALELSQIMQQEYTTIGELGWDFQIDHNGKPWMIEVNAKPLYRPKPDVIEKRKDVFKLIYAYAEYLYKGGQ